MLLSSTLKLAMYKFETLNVFTSTGYEKMTFPRFRPLLRGFESDTQVVRLGASWDGEPVGLALARAPSVGTAELLSIFVDARHRARGVGTALLTHFEKLLRESGSEKVELVYRKKNTSADPLERVIQKCGWTKPKTRMVVYKFDKNILAAPWLKVYSLPPSFSIFPWQEITLEERTAIQRLQESERWIPEYLVPFQYEDHMEPFSSLGLRYQGTVVGWLITHRVAPDTVRFTNLFVRSDLQKRGRAIALVVEAIKRQLTELGEDSHVILSVWLENAPALRFLERRVAPSLASISETRGSFKWLNWEVSR